MLGADLNQISVNGPDLVLMILTAVHISHSQIEREENRVVLTLNECGIESRPQLLASLHDLRGVLEVTDDLDNS